MFLLKNQGRKEGEEQSPSYIYSNLLMAQAFQERHYQPAYLDVDIRLVGVQCPIALNARIIWHAAYDFYQCPGHIKRIC